MYSFDQLLKSRRSAMKFIPNVPISTEELEEMFQLATLAPSSFNLQHAHYMVIIDPDEKERLREAAYGQYKIHTASAAIVVLGDLNAYKQAEEIYNGMLLLGMMDRMSFDQMIQDITSLYEGRGASFQHEEAIRNASLSAMLFMLIAKEHGWDTCPMIGFDVEAVRKEFHIPANLVPAMMITIGKEDDSKVRPRGYRKPVGQFVHFGSF